MISPRARRIVGDVALGLGVAWLLVVTFRVSRWTATLPPTPWGGPRPGGWISSPMSGAAELPWDVLSVVLALLIGAALAGRRLAPWPALAAAIVLGVGYTVLGGPVPPALIAPAVIAATAVLARPGRRWWLPTLLGVAVLAWAPRWTTPGLGLGEPPTYLGVVAAVALVLIPMLITAARLERRRAAERARADELERAAADERLRIARDIHDVVGHSLSMISLQAGVALHVIDADPAQVRASLQAIRASSRDSLAEIRRTLNTLRTDDAAPLVPTGGLAAVPALVSGVRAAGREVELIMDGDPAAVPASWQRVGHRVVQESLTNAVRHADGASIRVLVDAAPDRLHLAITDDGPTVASYTPGHGLRGIGERVAAVGGRVEHGPGPEGGFAVRAWFGEDGPTGRDDHGR